MCKGNDFSPNEQRFFPKCEAQASEKALFNISPTLSPLNPPCAARQNRKRSLSLPPVFPLASFGVPSSFPWRSLSLPPAFPLPSFGVPSSFPLNSPFFPLLPPFLPSLLSLFVPFFIPRFYRGRPFPSSSVPNTNFQSTECNLQTQLASVQTQLASIQMQLASLRTQPASELPTYPNRTISHAPAGFTPAFRSQFPPAAFLQLR